MNIETPTVVLHVVKAIAAAAIIGGGTVVLDTQRDNAVQDTKIEELARQQSDLGAAVRDLNESVRSLDRNAAELNGYMRGRERIPPVQ